MVVAEIIEIQIGLHLDRHLLYPHEPSEFQGHRQIGVPLRLRVTISALFRLLDLRDIYNRNCRYLFYVEGSCQKTRVKNLEKKRGE